MATPFLKLKPNLRSRSLSGHPWVFVSEVAELLPKTENGNAVELVDAKGRLVGTGIYNADSQIIWRRFSRDRRALDRAFLTEAIEHSIARRKDETVRRLVWSEADCLPGLVVDQFDHVLVMQALTLAMDKQLPVIADIFQALLQPQEIIFRNDAPSRQYEGLNLTVTTASGETPQPDWFKINGFSYYLDFFEGHKTGFYLDQREQHQRVTQYAQGAKVLDAFCNQGAFAMHCAHAGARSVLAIDSSAQCSELARKNAEKNGLDISVECANMFDWFTKEREQKFDLIILDPPSFARNKKALKGAMRGYKELNLRAMKLLNPGGILATYCCSQSVDGNRFHEMLADASGDARRNVRLLELTGQPLDHPVLVSMPESHYIKGAILQVD